MSSDKPFLHRRPPDQNALSSHPPSSSVPHNSPLLPRKRHPIILHPEVAHALSSGCRPVVALESTIIAHGMPHPQNIQTAHALENTVRAQNAVPATIAILAGTVRVGLTAQELAHIASHTEPTTQNHPTIRKVARRDIATCIADRADGATTVSATLHIAALVGIPVLATGGIGGIHRGVQHTWDISADIAALAEIPVLVVCAGIKTVLDVPKTLEALETASVLVATLNPDHGEFPGFYTRRCGVKTPHTVTTETNAAQLFLAHAKIVAKGMLVAVPVPKQYEASTAKTAEAVQSAIMEAQEKNVSGSEVTPFLLARIAKLTSNESLAANIELVKNNAAVAARIAVQIRILSRGIHPPLHRDPGVALQSYPPDVVVIGGLAWDITAFSNNALLTETSNPGTVHQSLGGVGRNIAETIHGSGLNVVLLSAVGADRTGNLVLKALESSGLRTDGITVLDGEQTAIYCAVHRNCGELDVAISYMSIFDRSVLQFDHERKLLKLLSRSKFVCIDANLGVEDIGLVLSVANQYGLPVWFEPVSVSKSTKILSPFHQGKLLDFVHFMSPNESELKAMCDQCHSIDGDRHSTERAEPESDARLMLRVHAGPILTIVCTRGSKGVSIFSKSPKRSDQDVYVRHVPAAPVPGGKIVSVSGAGDVLAGTMIAHIVRSGPDFDIEASAEAGVIAAAASCAETSAAPTVLSKL